ncbi:hypothetical protein C8R43DRAFT_904362 [Mycena crocata]|nr:hypothetical protein C8R43DRAFT_904362 [Mycena crocata]
MHATGRFVKNDTWRVRNRHKLHPYLGTPYMLSYDVVMLQSDRATNNLMRCLVPPGSPAYKPFGGRPPATVLDLGCGEGVWLADAARIWRGSQFIGLDLVDILLPALTDGSIPNVRLVRGDFINYPLPFPAGRFDYVRLANLGLCVPEPCWEYILREVERVLAPDGRLEWFDDQMAFPYGDTPFGEAIDIPKEMEMLPATTPTAHIATEPAKPLSPSTPRAPPPTPESSGESEPDVPLGSGPWSTQRSASLDLERVYTRMLKTEYNMHPKPAEFAMPLLKRVFGHSARVEKASMHLKLAPSSKKEEWAAKDTPIPQGLSAKAAERLGIVGAGVPQLRRQPTLPTIPVAMTHTRGGSNASTASCASALSTASDVSVSSSTSTASSGAWSATGPHEPRFSHELVQHPGLVLWPNTFIPQTPMELELHATKHMTALLGSKHALGEYVSTYTDATGERLVSDEEFQEALWQYECFRRWRFNWPELPDDDEAPDLPTPSSARSMHHPIPPRTPTTEAPTNYKERPFGSDELTHVRTFRVFTATKGPKLL